MGRPFPTEHGSLLGPQVFNQQGGPTFHGWKDLFAIQAPWAVSGPISKPDAQASGLWRLVPFHRAGGLSRGRETAATATGKKRGANRARPSTDTPLGWGGCRPGEGQWAWACLLGEEPPWREVCLVVTVTALRPVGAPAQSGLCVQEYSQGPATWPGRPRGPHHRVCVCVCVCVCVGQGRALSTFIGHARRLVGAWGGGLFSASDAPARLL